MTSSPGSGWCWAKKSRQKFPQLCGVGWKHAITIWIRNICFSVWAGPWPGYVGIPKFFPTGYQISSLNLTESLGVLKISFSHKVVKHHRGSLLEGHMYRSAGPNFDCKSVFAPCHPACSFECMQTKAKTIAKKKAKANCKENVPSKRVNPMQPKHLWFAMRKTRVCTVQAVQKMFVAPKT